MPDGSAPDPYRRLLELAARENELVADGLLEEAERVIEERERLVASLPPVPPPEARASLERAAALQAQTTGALEAARAGVIEELRRLGTGRTTVRGYAPGAGAAASVDLAG